MQMQLFICLLDDEVAVRDEDKRIESQSKTALTKIGRKQSILTPLRSKAPNKINVCVISEGWLYTK